MKNLTDIIQPVACELPKFEALFNEALKADTLPMDLIMRYVADVKGKRLRPVLVFLSARLFDAVNEHTRRTAVFAEMIHNATLLHDDVVDVSDIRRGRLSVNARWSNSSAVLAGDYLLSKALLLMSQLEDRDILRDMLSTASAMCEGELLQNGDFVSHVSGEQESSYIDVITRKTAMLFRSCCVGGAMSVNAPKEAVELIKEFGINLGIVFQMRDDILDADDAESLAYAQKLMPVYLEKTMNALDSLAPMAKDASAFASLKELALFCANRAS